MRNFSIIIFHLMYLISFLSYSFFGITLQNGIITHSLIFLVVILNYLFSKSGTHYKKLVLMDYLIINFIFWSLFSIVAIYFDDRSYLIYLKGITYCLFPILAYFMFSLTKKEIDISVINSYLRYILVSSVIAVAVGLLFYFTTPGFYVNYVLNAYDGLINDEDTLFMARLLSYFGDPTAIGNIATLSIPILFYLNRTNKNFKRFKGLTFVFFLILYIGVIFSFARSAWVATLAFTIYHIFFKSNKIFLKYLIGFALFFSIVGLNVLSSVNVDNLILVELQKRVNSVGGSFEERNLQIEYGIGLITENPLGVGLGQAGHKSFSGDVFKGVFDNNYLRIISETGIVGFLSFILVLVTSLSMSFKKASHNEIGTLRSLLLVLILIFYFQAIGSNILDLHFSSFLYWSFLGILTWTFKYDYKIKNFIQK